MKTIFAFTCTFFLLAIPAKADCSLSTGKCWTDGQGNTYRTEENYGGSYSTSKNGSPYSTTDQTFGGGYRERFNDGGYNTYNQNPNADIPRKNYGYR